MMPENSQGILTHDDHISHNMNFDDCYQCCVREKNKNNNEKYPINNLRISI